jgi:hypothetical protein
LDTGLATERGETGPVTRETADAAVGFRLGTEEASPL